METSDGAAQPRLTSGGRAVCTTHKITVTLGSPGKYMLYIFNSAPGKTSNGKPITIN